MSHWVRVLVLCVFSCPAWTIAAEPGHACALVVDAGARLACYDKAFPLPPEVHEAAAKKAIDGFGLGDNTSSAPVSSREADAPSRQRAATGLRVDYGTEAYRCCWT